MPLQVLSCKDIKPGSTLFRELAPPLKCSVLSDLSDLASHLCQCDTFPLASSWLLKMINDVSLAGPEEQLGGPI